MKCDRTFCLFSADDFDQHHNILKTTLIQQDQRKSVWIIKQNAAAARFCMERLDAQEIGVKLEDRHLNGLTRKKANMLVGHKKQQGSGTELKSCSIGVKMSGACLYEVNTEVVGACGFIDVAVLSHCLKSNRFAARAWVVELSFHVAFPRCESISTPALMHDSVRQTTFLMGEIDV